MMKTSTSPAMRCFLLLFILFFSIRVSATHICDFSFNFPIAGCSPLLLSAAAHETDSADVVERIWQLTIGTTVIFTSTTGTNSPTYNDILSAPGTYCLRLTSRNSNGNICTIQKCNIEVYDKPVINFTFSPTSGCAPLLVNAQCNSTAGSGVIDSIIIDWHCGATTVLSSCPAAPIPHQYNCPPGCYNIYVLVHNSMGCWADTTYQNAVCIIPKPHAYFAGNVTTANCTSNPLNVNFTADSAGACMTYDWYINNVLSHSDTTRFFNHTFPINNNDCYDIMLVVRHCIGCSDTFLRSDYICVRQNPVISFITNFETSCLSQGGTAPLIITNTTPGLNQLTFQLTGPGGPYVTQTGSFASYNLSFIGTYIITAIGIFSPGCADTLTKTIFIKPSPTANFTTPDTFSCKRPYLVHYTASGCITCTDTWQLPGAFPSAGSGQSVIANYTGYAHYAATLTATDTNGCSATITKQLVNTVPLVAKMAFDHSKGCAPVCTVFDDVTDYTSVHSTPTSVCWSFDGPVNIPGACKDTIQRCFIDTGCYGVRLVVTTASGCVDSLYLRDTICVGEKPICTMTASPTSMCFEADSVCFHLTCANAFDRCHCTFGDGSEGDFYSADFCHLFQDTGIIHPCCIAYKDSCPSDTFCFAITVYPPISKFLDSTFCAKGDTVFLYNKSINATSVLWTFCNGDTSTQQNPRVALPECDTCTVRLQTHNNLTGCDHQKTRTINTACSSASFTCMDTSGCWPFAVHYINTSFSPGSTRWDWDCNNGTSFFGAGTSGGNAVTHTFTTPGVYCVAMRNVSASGCIDTVYGTVRVCELIPDFGPLTVCAPLPYCPIDSSTDSICGIVSWYWDFGDGQIDSVQHPCHQYLFQGTYQVTLVVVNNLGCTRAITQAVLVSAPLLINYGYDSILCEGSQLCIYNTSQPNILFHWDLPGAIPSSSNAAAPCFQFPSGSGDYVLHLKVTVPGSCFYDEYKTIHVHNPVAAGYAGTNSIACSYPPSVIPFYNQSQYYTSLVWDFGDNTYSYSDNPGHIYTHPNCHVVKLIATNTLGCADTTVIDTICSFGPSATFTQTPEAVCTCGDTVHFSIATVKATELTFLYGCSSGFQVVNPITPIGSTVNPTMINFNIPYCLTDTCYPQLLLKDSSGCAVYYSLNPVVLTLHSNFNYIQSGDTIQFTNWSTGLYQTIHWSFGDGDTSALSNPVHTYLTYDTFTVVLAVSDTIEGCYDDFSQTIIISLPQSVTEISEHYNIRVIPNPFNDYTLLKIEGENTTGAEIRIADLLGNIVRSFKTDASGIAKIERETLVSGMYIYEVRLQGKRIGNGKMIAQ